MPIKKKQKPKTKPIAKRKLTPKEPPVATTRKKAKIPAQPAPLEGKPKHGRQTVYTKELGDILVERLSKGQGLKTICRDDGMPDAHTVRRWALDLEHPFAPRYARAREMGMWEWADEILEISDNSKNDYIERLNKDGDTTTRVFDSENVQRSKLRADNRKWLLAKLMPKSFGDRLTQDVNVKDVAKDKPDVSESEGRRWIKEVLERRKVRNPDALTREPEAEDGDE